MPIGNRLAEMRQQSRECLDAQIMRASGQAQGRLPDQITESPKGLDTTPADSVLACCEALRAIGMSGLDGMQRLLQGIAMLGQGITANIVQDLLIPTRDSKSFIIPGTVTIAPSASGGGFVTIAQIKVPEGYMGILTHVGVMVSPNEAFSDIQWQLCSSGDADPYFAPSGFFFQASTLATPLQFYKVYPSQRIIEIKAKNTSVGPLNVSAVLVGFFRPLTSISVG